VLLIRIAAGLLALNALGFGISDAIGLRSLIATGKIAYIWGYPVYGGGQFERHGVPTTVPLLLGFLAVCVLELVAGWLLWNGQLPGGILALVLAPISALFFWGFDLPYAWVLVGVSTLLVLIGWRALT
jgi:hypothetical protein